ncbi:helix-turn-helix transcriptional regulator [Microbacterium sp. 1P10AE]|jgi:transcriptional regulator with XRE-family HTH domain|uniref:helix-turn-helix transcriptional regulator n=1 Tax=Microbacterium sp. 1P10AE TaxID=3132286 RepID=UPI0039A1D81B
MKKDNPLGEFLRARRELVRPEEVGLPSGSRRRVPGLRREEVATLAGISAEYYLRLEQGRDRHPSQQVLDALGDALLLDRESRAHANELARDRGRRQLDRPLQPSDLVPQGIAMLLETLNVPAFVMNRYRDVLAVNRTASALEPSLKVGRNRLISLFTDETARSYHPDWESSTASVVGQLRADIGTDYGDPRFQALVGELSLRSDRFLMLWSRHEVHVGGSAAALIDHPELGRLHLMREKLSVGADGLVLVIYHAAPGSASANSLQRLFSGTAR